MNILSFSNSFNQKHFVVAIVGWFTLSFWAAHIQSKWVHLDEYGPNILAFFIFASFFATVSNFYFVHKFRLIRSFFIFIFHFNHLLDTHLMIESSLPTSEQFIFHLLFRFLMHLTLHHILQYTRLISLFIANEIKTTSKLIILAIFL